MRLFLFALWTVILAELACGVRSLTLAALYRHPWTIFAGSMLGTAAVMIVAVFLGDALNFLSPTVLRILGGLFFVLYGILLLLKMV